MKHRSLITVAAFFLACGCASTKQERCERYESVYAAYLATTDAGIRPVAKEEAAAAAAAAVFLRLNCGWVGAGPATRGGSGSGPVDVNGVEILRKP